MVDPILDWPELVSFVFLIIGFILALLSSTFAIAYVVVFLMGMFFGRLWVRCGESGVIPYTMAMIAVVLGFIMGVLLANLQMVILLFVGGILLGFWIHKRGWVKSVEF